MIVMKFGGASLASPASIKRVAAIVRSEVRETPARECSHQESPRHYPAVVRNTVHCSRMTLIFCAHSGCGDGPEAT